MPPGVLRLVSFKLARDWKAIFLLGKMHPTGHQRVLELLDRLQRSPVNVEQWVEDTRPEILALMGSGRERRAATIARRGWISRPPA